MATFTMPFYLSPLLDFYNLKWPDIDEDKVIELGQQIQEVANAAHIFSLGVQGCLRSLSDESNSDALETMHEEWTRFTSGPVLNVTDSVGSGASGACLVVGNGITAYKGSILAIFTINVGSDIALIASGVGAPVAIAKKAVMREVLEVALEQLALQTADWLLGQWNHFLEVNVLSHIEKLADNVRNDIAGAVGDVAAMAIPTQGSTAAAALYIDHDDILHAAKRMKEAYDRLSTAIQNLRNWNKGTGYTTPLAVPPDPTLSSVLSGAFDWACDQITQLIDDIGNAVINNIVELVTGIYDKYIEADESLGALATELRSQFKFPPPTAPFVIDRSSQPKPVYILDAPPQVVTGSGVSDARAGIVVIDLPDAPDPVVTGAGESDARLNIRQILLPLDEEPITTGPGTSTARDSIQDIDLTPAGGEQ